MVTPFKKKGLVFILIFSTTFLTSCDSMSKREIGTGIGAVAGAIIGSQFGKGSGRTAAVLVGGLLGSWIGNSIGNYLDKKDQEALMRQSAEMINRQNGETAVWESDHSGSSATIKTSNSEKKQKKVKVVKVKKVDTTPRLELIGETYVSTASSNVRHAPNKSGQVISGLKNGEKFTAVGKTDNDWVLVAKNNITVGYVYGSLVKQSSSNNNQPIRDGAISLDDIDEVAISNANKSKQEGINLDKIDLEEASVATETECKNVSMDIKSEKGETTESFETCKGSDGAWEII